MLAIYSCYDNGAFNSVVLNVNSKVKHADGFYVTFAFHTTKEHIGVPKVKKVQENKMSTTNAARKIQLDTSIELAKLFGAFLTFSDGVVILEVPLSCQLQSDDCSKNISCVNEMSDYLIFSDNFLEEKYTNEMKHTSSRHVSEFFKYFSGFVLLFGLADYIVHEQEIVPAYIFLSSYSLLFSIAYSYYTESWFIHAAITGLSYYFAYQIPLYNFTSIFFVMAIPMLRFVLITLNVKEIKYFGVFQFLVFAFR